LYSIAYTLKSGMTQKGSATTAADAVEKIRLYRAAGISQFSVKDPRGRTLTLEELRTLADIGH